MLQDEWWPLYLWIQYMACTVFIPVVVVQQQGKGGVEPSVVRFSLLR